MYEIKKHVPMPHPKSCSSQMYPFDQMEVGDMFEVEIPNGFERSTIQARLSNVISNRKKVSDHRYSLRSFPTHIGVWRIK